MLCRQVDVFVEVRAVSTLSAPSLQLWCASFDIFRTRTRVWVHLPLVSSVSILLALFDISQADVSRAIFLVAGIMVFGSFNAVNSQVRSASVAHSSARQRVLLLQINMYVLSRVVLGSARTLVNKGILAEFDYGMGVGVGGCLPPLCCC